MLITGLRAGVGQGDKGKAAIQGNYFYIFGVQKEAAVLPLWGLDIHLASEAEAAFTRDLYAAAVTACRAALCFYFAVIAGGFVRPDDHSAAVALLPGIGGERHVHQGRVFCVGDVCIFALPTAADTQQSAALRAVGRDTGPGQNEVASRQGNVAAGLAACRIGARQVGPALGFDPDGSCPALRGVCLECGGRRLLKAFRGGEADLPALGNGGDVEDARFHNRLARNGNLTTLIARGLQAARIHCHARGGNVDASRRRAIRGRIETARLDNLVGIQDDPAVFINDSFGFNNAAVVDHRLRQLIDRPGGHFHQSALCLD